MTTGPDRRNASIRRRTPQSQAALERTLALAEARLAAAPSPELFLAVRAPGSAADPAGVPPRSGGGAAAAASTLSADEIAGAICRRQADDGSWGGDLVRTAETLLLLAELAGGSPDPDVAAAAGRARGWIRGRRNRPGRFGAGCDAERHAAALCHHYLGGFFSACPPDRQLDWLRLACGAHIAADADARLVASCTALRALLRWGAAGTDVELHLDGVRRIVKLATAWSNAIVGPPGILAALAALLEADRPGDRAGAAAGLEAVVRAQRADGTWPDADLFQALEVLDAAADRGLWTDELAGAADRAAAMLVSAQREDGSWSGRDTRPRQLLIAVRTLRRVVGGQT